jgi:putative adenylate-forming enzyme
MTRPSLAAQFYTARAFLRTQTLARRLKTRADIERFQAARLRHLLRHVAPRVAAYRGMTGRALRDFPVMDKAVLMAGFENYNRAGITAATAWAALADTGQIGDLSVGASTGTSGNRGLYLVSSPERYTWLGVLLAKALPDVRRARHRVAIILPANSRLYDAANETGPLTLKFFDLGAGLHTHTDAIARFAPSVIVAPPKVLRALALADLPLAPRAIFSGAEVLDSLDRAVIEARFGVTVREIYMATEGLFAVACAHGTLHLAEDAVAFEWDAPDPAANLRAPVITDFTRRTQLMLRYRMNDLLQHAETPCACGSPLQAISAIAGRLDDVFLLPDAKGLARMVTPDILRNAVVGADRRIDDFRLIQTGARTVHLILPPGPPDRLAAAAAALTAQFHRAGAVDVQLTCTAEPLRAPEDRKLRRVRRDFTP